MNTEKVQQEINNVILNIRAKGWRYTKTTKKALAELEALGLSAYVTSRDLPCAEIVNAIIAAAKDAGGKKTTDSGFIQGEGYSVSSTSQPSTLYLALNETEPTPETIITSGGKVVIEKLEDGGYEVHSPYESQSADTLEKANKIANEMATILDVGWENS